MLSASVALQPERQQWPLLGPSVRLLSYYRPIADTRSSIYRYSHQSINRQYIPRSQTQNSRCAYQAAAKWSVRHLFLDRHNFLIRGEVVSLTPTPQPEEPGFRIHIPHRHGDPVTPRGIGWLGYLGIANFRTHLRGPLRGGIRYIRTDERKFFFFLNFNTVISCRQFLLLYSN